MGDKKLVLIIVISLALAGCAAEFTTPLQAVDRHAIVPAIRLGKTFDGTSDFPSEPQSGSAVESNIVWTSGSDDQQLGEQQLPLEVGRESFPGPQLVQHDFKLQFADVSYRWRSVSGDLGWEGLIGLGHAKLDLLAFSETQQASESLGEAGVAGGFGGIWLLAPRMSLQSRVMAFATDDHTEATRLEIFGVRTLGPHVAVRAGYTVWQLSMQRSIASDIDIEISGLSFGLDFEF